jgi:hypothetical protein
MHPRTYDRVAPRRAQLSTDLMVAQSSTADQADIPAESGSFRVSDGPRVGAEKLRALAGRLKRRNAACMLARTPASR